MTVVMPVQESAKLANGLIPIFIPMMFGADAPTSSRDQHMRFTEQDHIPQRLSIPGWVRGEHYWLTTNRPIGSTSTEPPYDLRFYYIESPEALTGVQYQRQTGQGTAFSKSLPRLDPPRVGMLRACWVPRPSPWETVYFAPAEGPKTYLIEMSEVSQDHEAEYNRFLDEERIPERLGCPGFLRCERYESAPVTIPGPPQDPKIPSPKYMTIFHLDCPEAVTTEAYRDHATFQSDWARNLAGKVNVSWHGTYLQRPSPWTVGPVVVR